MVLANSANLEANPEDNIITIEDIEETGLTQQPMVVCPTPPPEELPGTQRDHPDTHPLPWSDQEEVSDPEYPEQPDDPGDHPGNNSQTRGNTENAPDTSQS